MEQFFVENSCFFLWFFGPPSMIFHQAAKDILQYTQTHNRWVAHPPHSPVIIKFRCFLINCFFCNMWSSILLYIFILYDSHFCVRKKGNSHAMWETRPCAWDMHECCVPGVIYGCRTHPLYLRAETRKLFDSSHFCFVFKFHFPRRPLLKYCTSRYCRLPTYNVHKLFAVLFLSIPFPSFISPPSHQNAYYNSHLLFSLYKILLLSFSIHHTACHNNSFCLFSTIHTLWFYFFLFSLSPHDVYCLSFKKFIN